MLVLDYPLRDNAATSNWEVAETALTDAVAATGQRAVIVSTLPETMPVNVQARLKARRITPMQGLEECLFAISAAAMIGAVRSRGDDLLPVHEPFRIDGDVRTLDEWQSKAELAGRGLSIPDGRLCSAEETVAAAEALGYPVVLKAVSSDIAHKSELGAVALNLRDAKAVADATARMAEHFQRFLVEQMVGPTVAELIIGVHRDQTFGLSLLIGAGGTLVELVDDTVSLLLPARREEIDAAIRTLKVAKLIESYRSAASGDFATVVDAVAAVADYAIEHRATLAELDINPLIVLPNGAIAADAFIRRSGEDA
jgi:acetyl-CoA synthetase